MISKWFVLRNIRVVVLDCHSVESSTDDAVQYIIYMRDIWGELMLSCHNRLSCKTTNTSHLSQWYRKARLAQLGVIITRDVSLGL